MEGGGGGRRTIKLLIESSFLMDVHAHKPFLKVDIAILVLRTRSTGTATTVEKEGRAKP
jgi:hypothetical protein